MQKWFLLFLFVASAGTVFPQTASSERAQTTSSQVAGQIASTQVGPRLFSRLTVNKTHIAFSYAGDIWIVERGGGEARKLTTSPADENFPAFSPDGSQLAFSRQVGGNWDVYVMPVTLTATTTAEPRRLTFDPRGDFVNGWSPDGRASFLTPIAICNHSFTRSNSMP